MDGYAFPFRGLYLLHETFDDVGGFVPDGLQLDGLEELVCCPRNRALVCEGNVLVAAIIFVVDIDDDDLFALLKLRGEVVACEERFPDLEAPTMVMCS